MSRYTCWKCKAEHGTKNVEAVCISCYDIVVKKYHAEIHDGRVRCDGFLKDRDAELERFRGEVARKDEALKPFALLWLPAWDYYRNDDPVYGENKNHVTAGHLRAARAALTPAPNWLNEKLAEVSQKMQEELLRRGDLAYMDYMSQCKRTECLGAHAKMASGLFGHDELTAHQIAQEFLGKHKGYHDAANALRESSKP